MLFQISSSKTESSRRFLSRYVLLPAACIPCSSSRCCLAAVPQRRRTAGHPACLLGLLPFSSECGRAWTAGKRGQRASTAARPSAASSASRRARPHARAQPAGGTAGAEARRRRGRATCANGERSLRRCGQRVRRAWPARRRGLNGRAGRVQDELEGRAEEGVAALWVLRVAAWLLARPTGFEGRKSSAH